MISKIKKPVSILLSLIMVFSLFTIVPMTAQAASHNITINNAQNGSVTASVNGSTVTSAEEGSTVTLTATPNNGYRLKSISGTYKGYPYEAKSLSSTKNLTGTYFSYTATDAAGAGWKLANNSSITITSTSKKIIKLEFNMYQRGTSFNVNNVSCTAGTKSLSGNTFVVSSVNTQSITLSSSANNAGYVRFNSVKVYYNGDAVDETLSISGTGNVRTFIMPVVAEGAVTITPEFEESPKYSVTLTGGANATASGNTEQTGIVEGNSMDTVTYTANSGYYFAEFTNITNNGITAMRINETTVTVSGTPTANASITIPDAVFAHTHDFTYSASGATITATCNGAGDCDITEGLTMTISAPTGDLTADGSKTFPATLNDDYNTTAFPGTYTIAYTKDGQPYDGTPTEAGDYTASVTVGTATASVSYTAQFDATPYVASVTSNGTTTKYTDFGTAVSNWTNGSTLTLLADVQTDSTINVTGTQTLDLNGHGIKRTGNGNVINVGSANLTLNDSNPSQTHKFDPPSGGVGLAMLNEENGALTINGGYITGGCNVNYGGGILVGAGRLTMNGGNIIGNKAVSGGGVSVKGGAGTFTLNGGSVSYNEGINLGGGIMSYGSGGHPNQGLLKINGGSVQYNTCPKSGGIFSQTAMELSGSPNISGNKETSGKDSNLTFYGNTNIPGEYMYCIIKVTGELTPVTPIGVMRLTTGENGWENPCAGVFTASDNTSFNDAGKFKSDDVNYKVVKNADGQLELKEACTVTWKNGDTVLKTEKVAKGTTPQYSGETPTKEDDDNAYTFTGWTPALAPVTADATYTATFDATPYVASVTSNGTTTKYTDFGTAVSNWTNGSTLTLLANVTTSSVIRFESGVKTLDLNGYGIKNTSANYQASNSVIYISGSGTQLTLQDSRPNETTHYFTAPAGNAGLATDISDIDSGDQQSFHGGYLTGGNCFSGGGIRVDNGANLIMTGGTIIGNRGQYGGGIDVEKNISAGGSATISGGAIMYNYGTNYNGAIHTNGANYVSVSNCKITNNYAEHGAGGANKSSINGGFSGNLIIKDNKTGNTECNVIIESNQYISLTSALGENASIGITMNNPGVFTNSSTTDYNVASKFKSDNVNYKVVKNANGQLELDPKLFVGNTITLNGDIGVNFFINSAYANFNGAQTATVVFTWDNGNCTKEVNLKDLETDGNGHYKATCDVVAAHMAHKIHAVVYLNGAALDETNDFSVQDYAEELFNHPEKYDTKGRPVALKALAKALLNYGAMAQIMFDSALKEKPDLANKNVGATDLTGVTAEQVTAAIKVANDQNTGADMTTVAAALHANWYTTTVIYLSKNTVKHYFTKADDSFNASAYQGNQSNYYYFVQKENIAAADLDTLQEFKVGDYTFKYSALDYVVAVINSNMSGKAKNIAKALFLYNQAANAYFD